MRVSLFGLFLRGTNLMGPWPKLVQSVLLVIGFIRFYRFYVSLGDIWCCPIYFTSHPFSYLIIPWVVPAWYHLFYIYLLLHAYLCSPLGIRITTRLGSSIWLPWILMSRLWSLERVDSPSCWSEWRSGSIDLQQTIWSSTFQAPLCASRVFLL